MAGIYERVTAVSESGVDKLPVHSFMAAMREATRGNVTLQQVKSRFEADATMSAEIDAIASTYMGLSTDDERTNFREQLHDALLLAEAGFYDKATVKARLGF
jgi:hypothetical protein